MGTDRENWAEVGPRRPCLWLLTGRVGDPLFLRCKSLLRIRRRRSSIRSLAQPPRSGKTTGAPPRIWPSATTTPKARLLDVRPGGVNSSAEENGVRYNGIRIRLKPFLVISTSRDGKNTKTITRRRVRLIDVNRPAGFSVSPAAKTSQGPVTCTSSPNVQIRDNKGTPNDPKDDVKIVSHTLDYDEPTQQITTESHVVIEDPDMVTTGRHSSSFGTLRQAGRARGESSEGNPGPPVLTSSRCPIPVPRFPGSAVPECCPGSRSPFKTITIVEPSRPSRSRLTRRLKTPGDLNMVHGESKVHIQVAGPPVKRGESKFPGTSSSTARKMRSRIPSA